MYDAVAAWRCFRATITSQKGAASCRTMLRRELCTFNSAVVVNETLACGTYSVRNRRGERVVLTITASVS